MKWQLTFSLGLLCLAAAALIVSVGVAQPSEHPHMLVQQVEFGEIDGQPAVLGWRKCVDLAANQKLPNNAHHAHAHTGRAGEALSENANIQVVPGSPLTPWASCAELEAALPILLE